MARPKHKLKRDRQFNVSLTARELELLHERAAASGLRPVDYGRARLFGERRTTEGNAASGPRLDPFLINQLSRLGNLINQIARKMHALNQPAPPSLEALLREIRALINKGAAGGS